MTRRHSDRRVANAAATPLRDFRPDEMLTAGPGVGVTRRHSRIDSDGVPLVGVGLSAVRMRVGVG